MLTVKFTFLLGWEASPVIFEVVFATFSLGVVVRSSFYAFILVFKFSLILAREESVFDFSSPTGVLNDGTGLFFGGS